MTNLSSESTQGAPDWDAFIEIINHEVVPALGCTEPVAIAYAAAYAASLVDEPVLFIEAKVSANLLKNGMGVSVPGTGQTGLGIAAAAGALGGDHHLGLEVLAGLDEANAEQARTLVKSGKVKISLADTTDLIYAEIEIKTENSSAKAFLQHEHTNIIRLEKDGQEVFSKDDGAQHDELRKTWPMSIAKIYEFATTAPFERIAFILKSADMNMAVAKEGLKHRYGLQLGKVMDENIGRNLMADDSGNYAIKLTAAASDARMDGVLLPVMSNSGSGNQGITCTVPVCAFAERLGSPIELLSRALIMSHLTAIHIKHYLGRLSALCGATVAATGASCGIVMLLGGNLLHISNAVKNMIGNVAGMICDGAKTSCALKVASSVGAAVQAAFLGMSEIAVSGKEGIVANDLEECIRNLGRLGSEGMIGTDKVILDIMVAKQGS